MKKIEAGRIWNRVSERFHFGVFIVWLSRLIRFFWLDGRTETCLIGRSPPKFSASNTGSITKGFLVSLIPNTSSSILGLLRCTIMFPVAQSETHLYSTIARGAAGCTNRVLLTLFLSSIWSSDSFVLHSLNQSQHLRQHCWCELLSRIPGKIKKSSIF